MTNVDIWEKLATVSKEQIRSIHERTNALRKKYQDGCPHMQGSNEQGDPSLRGQYTSIVWHVYEDDEYDRPKGICTNCLRIFRSTDPDYDLWHDMRSGNQLSTCGLPRPRADGTTLVRPSTALPFSPGEQVSEDAANENQDKN